MKIEINNWSLFEKENGLYFTRDINISKQHKVYVIAGRMKKTCFFVYIDFVSWKYLGFVKANKAIKIIDDRHDEDWVNKKAHFTSKD